MDKFSTEVRTAFLDDTPAVVTTLLGRAKLLKATSFPEKNRGILAKLIRDDLRDALGASRRTRAPVASPFSRRREKDLGDLLVNLETTAALHRNLFTGWDKDLPTRVAELKQLVELLQEMSPSAGTAALLYRWALGNPWYALAWADLGETGFASPLRLETLAFMDPTITVRLDDLCSRQIRPVMRSEERAFAMATRMLRGILDVVKMDYELFGAIIPACTVDYKDYSEQAIANVLFSGRVFAPQNPASPIWKAVVSQLVNPNMIVDDNEDSSEERVVKFLLNGETVMVPGAVRYRHDIGFRVASEKDAISLANIFGERLGYEVVDCESCIQLLGERRIEIFWDKQVHTSGLLYFDSNSRFIQRDGKRTVELTATAASVLATRRFRHPTRFADDPDEIFDAITAGFGVRSGWWNREMPMMKQHSRGIQGARVSLDIPNLPWVDIWNLDLQRKLPVILTGLTDDEAEDLEGLGDADDE